MQISLGTGTGTFTTGQNTGVGADGPQAAAIGDLDNDSNLDVVVASSFPGSVSVLPGAGDGTFTVGYTTTPLGQFSDVTLADFNGDGDTDVAVAANVPGGVQVLLGNGDGTLGTAASYPAGSYTTGVDAGDLDGDGDVDLVASNLLDNTVTVLLNTGAGAFAASATKAVGSSPNGVTLGDLDGDGDLDAVAYNFGDDLSVLVGDGAGGLADEVRYASTTFPSGVAITDLNSDGNVDLAVSGINAGTAVHLGNGDGTFEPRVIYPGYGAAFSAAAGDLNSDGRPDIVLAHAFDDRIASFLNTTVVDTEGPTVVITAPADGSTVLLGAALTADYSCTDDVDPDPSCVGDVADGAAISTASPGAQQFSVTGTDATGNSTTAVSHYLVAYGFTGFAAPVNNAPEVNLVRAGQTVPVKWRLVDADGAGIDDPASFRSLTSKQIACVGGAATDPVEETASGNSGLQYNLDGNWQYNWQTPKSYAKTCREMTVTLADGTTHTALFQFR